VKKEQQLEKTGLPGLLEGLSFRSRPSLPKIKNELDTVEAKVETVLKAMTEIDSLKEGELKEVHLDESEDGSNTINFEVVAGDGEIVSGTLTMTSKQITETVRNRVETLTLSDGTHYETDINWAAAPFGGRIPTLNGFRLSAQDDGGEIRGQALKQNEKRKRKIKFTNGNIIQERKLIEPIEKLRGRLHDIMQIGSKRAA